MRPGLVNKRFSSDRMSRKHRDFQSETASARLRCGRLSSVAASHSLTLQTAVFGCCVPRCVPRFPECSVAEHAKTASRPASISCESAAGIQGFRPAGGPACRPRTGCVPLCAPAGGSSLAPRKRHRPGRAARRGSRRVGGGPGAYRGFRVAATALRWVAWMSATAFRRFAGEAVSGFGQAAHSS